MPPLGSVTVPVNVARVTCAPAYPVTNTNARSTGAKRFIVYSIIRSDRARPALRGSCSACMVLGNRNRSKMNAIFPKTEICPGSRAIVALALLDSAEFSREWRGDDVHSSTGATLKKGSRKEICPRFPVRLLVCQPLQGILTVRMNVHQYSKIIKYIFSFFTVKFTHVAVLMRGLSISSLLVNRNP